MEKVLPVIQFCSNQQYLVKFQQYSVSERGREKSNESLGHSIFTIATGSIIAQ
jgi:hypothetical protein